MRILQVNSLFNGGGADNQMLDLAVGLRELGEDVTVAIPLGCFWEPLARQAGLRVAAFPRLGPLKSAVIGRWVRLIRERDIQVIHAHQGRDYWPAIAAARLARRGTRAVVTRHLMTRPRLFSRWFLLSMANVIAVSQAVETVLGQELCGPKSRLRQIYGGIDVARFHSVPPEAVRSFRRRHGWSDDTVVLGVVGAYGLPRGKGQLEFLEAASRLREPFPRARFAVVGQGTMESLLRERIAARNLANVVAMIPFTNDVPLVMNALDVLVHPALGTEALGLVLWEAMASAKPVIASRLHGIPEAFVPDEHGLLVPPMDVPALAEAMRRLLADAGLRERLGRAGRQHVEQHFTRARLAARTLELYRSLVA